MAGTGKTGIFLGLDIGRVNTRVSVFGISEGKYRLLGSKTARTDYGYDGHLAAGVQEALGKLEEELNLNFVLSSAPEGGKVAINQQIVDQVGLSLSSLPPVKAALFGMTAEGSLAAGMALIGQLPITLAGAYGLADLANEPAIIESLIKIRPEILVLTGGEDSGAETPLTRWVEISRLVCRALPEAVKPTVFFAGNPKTESIVRRRLEPICQLVVLPNLQPVVGERDHVPAQAAIGRYLLSMSLENCAGLSGLTQLAGDLIATRGFALDRMVRFISRSRGHRPKADKNILAIDVGAGSTLVCAGNGGQTAAFRRSTWEEDLGAWLVTADGPVHHWTAAPVNHEDTTSFLAKQHLFPEIIPQSLTELALSQSLARYQIRSGLQGLVERVDNFPYDEKKGLFGDYEQVIAGGAALTNAPTDGQAMLMLLDGLQPWREITLVLDRYQILPLLGLIGEAEPVLPVHLLDSDAFTNLGTVLPVVSDVPEGVMVLSMNVAMASGKAFDVDVPKGSLRQLIVPSGESVILTLDPISDADVGAGLGVKRQIKVTGGSLGVVIDARGRPLVLPMEDDERLERLRHWLWTLGG